MELNREAVRDAAANSRKNGVTNAIFFQGDAGEFMTDLAERGERADVVFMDPPRAGSDQAFLDAVKKLGPEKIVYISCNPETLARDLKSLSGEYQVREMWPVDMFPFTGHTEVVTGLERRRRQRKKG